MGRTGTVARNKRRRRTGTVSQLKEQLSLYIRKSVDDNSGITIAAIHELLLEQFPDLTITKSLVYRHIKNECALSFKRLEKLTQERNSEKTIFQRKECVEASKNIVRK
ncbi:hypothetical protein BDF20DRAFT_874578 [Mycotypha africana]|uniref:uncharacterized protein n=1 Tax=Mycotypha africana TaxID=64632 RepID=UPI0023016FE5|nr:uncharacterized protein BDF20DRAFT_874578 [Mycotypha africana]KAI8977398.1 hypothetical protein BDF20DRAFT_874578 [Mycotypha africana]